MANEKDGENPYQSSPSPAMPDTIDVVPRRRRIAGSLLGTLGFCVGAAPTLYILCILIAGWYNLATVTPRPQSIRPMGLPILALGLCGIGLVACSPIALICAWAAARLGSKTAAGFARLGAAMFFLPLPLSVLMIWLMCLCTGVRLGS